MDRRPVLARAIHAMLPASGPVVWLGPASVITSLVPDPLPAQTVLIDDRTRPARLARQTPAPRVIRGEPMSLPLPRRRLDGLVAAHTLNRRAKQGAAMVMAWSELLRPGAILALVERLHLGATRRVLTRLFRPGSGICAEDLTCWLLNAGYAEIRQALLDEESGIVLTTGRLRSL